MNWAFWGTSGDPPVRVNGSASGVKNTRWSSVEAPPLIRKRVDGSSAQRANADSGPSRGDDHRGGDPPAICRSPSSMMTVVWLAWSSPPVIFRSPSRNRTKADDAAEEARQPTMVVRQVDDRFAVGLAVLNRSAPPVIETSPSKITFPPVKFRLAAPTFRSLQLIHQLPVNVAGTVGLLQL